MSLLLKSANIGVLELKNRVVMPPMCMYKSDESGEIKDFHKYHYVSRALGGVGFIIVEATAIEPKGRISSNDLGLWDDSLIEKHKQLNKDIHSFGAKTAIQIAHAGRKSIVTDSTPIAPSSIAFSKEAPYKLPKEVSIEEIKDIKELFIKAAFRAKEADYDAIELHAAHGYLLCEFLSPISNNRTDIYGGTLENRCRLVLEIATEIKQKLDLPLIVRISADEWMSGGWNIEDSIYLSKELEKIGVDAIHVSSGGNLEKPDNAPTIQPLYQSSWAKKIKENVNIPVIAVGLITTAIEGEYLLENSTCDFVAYGRELLRNPNFVFYAANEFKEKEKINSSYQRAFV
ncbi:MULTISPECIES: NADH:flavin oxidoreductase/NADH oxidase [Arcobacter]|uniref:NADH:flavin oxidoreductase n=1 Tax=Arcobacter ellisii TaxID=913109 RepID=A0A347U8U7_9BACT|nr:NADH:flavin oxidoreductase/NADH oxidase [Arcobacter ellisii]AXX95275.1 old yellow enzyme (OYE)-related FMN binding domain-containing protein [Arcobacter ellisii]RXI30077.1 NADH:flavin oxidoreductase [Arcobacter ellisii]